MRHSKKTQLPQDTRKNRLRSDKFHSNREWLLTLIIFLVGIICIAYLISGGRNLIKNWIELRQVEVSKIRLEVLNGTDIRGLAEDASEFLRKKGFDVVRYGNSDIKVSETVIIDRADPDLKNAKVVRSILRQGKLCFEPHPLQLLEVSVVLGIDFKIKKEASIIENK